MTTWIIENIAIKEGHGDPPVRHRVPSGNYKVLLKLAGIKKI
jgi:hypothetical protein